MQLVNMKLTVEEAKSESMICASPDLPKYPYGLSIRLCDEVLKKLSITELPEVGSAMQLMAVVEVTHSRQSESQLGKDRELTMQITDMALSGKTEASRDTDSMAKSLYGSTA